MAGEGREEVSGIPGYWMNETSGALRPAVLAYLAGDEIKPEHIMAMRAYLRQWIAAPGFCGPQVEQLRADVDFVASRKSLNEWINLAIDAGVDPL